MEELDSSELVLPDQVFYPHHLNTILHLAFSLAIAVHCTLGIPTSKFAKATVPSPHTVEPLVSLTMAIPTHDSFMQAKLAHGCRWRL
ncbi:hypothetical protein M422DRAFT_240246 [Sphaerobolus stellatus SS14]|nr:hypothetical protein M422DRAFT_240246 [Sphaerobolus stellatus SS14]